MKRWIAIFLLMATVLGLFSGCGRSIDNSSYQPTGDALLMEGEEPAEAEDAEDTQELALAYYPDRSLNPLFGSDYTNRIIMSLMYQPLFAVDNQKNVTPILCSNYRASTNLRTWVFGIEKSATFSDGSKLTIQDVMASFNQAMGNDYYKNRFFHVVKLEILESGELAVYLDTPMENLPLLLDVPIVKAAEVEATMPLGTGPYQFSSGVGGAKLLRVNGWWCGKLKIPATDESIELVNVSSVADVRDAFQFGDVSVVCTNPMSASFAEYRSDYELWEIESGMMMYIGCNIQWSPFFEDGKLRTFLTYAIDRQTFADEQYKGMVDVVTLPCSPRESSYSNNLANAFQFDAITFMGKMQGFRIPQKKGGGDEEMRLVVNSNDSARVEIARSIASTLTDLGLPCITKEYTSGVFRDVLYSNNFDIYLGLTRLSADLDLTEFFRPYGEMGYGSIVNETLYNMNLNALENSGTRYNLYKKLAEDGRIIPVLFGYYNVYARRGLMPDLNPSRDNVFYYSMGKTMQDIKQEMKES